MKIEMKPLSMIEAKEIVEASGKNKEAKDFLKRFVKISKKDAANMRKELEGLGFMKMKGEHIVKIIDMLPDDASDTNKIFSDVNLDENEINKILEIVKKYK